MNADKCFDFVVTDFRSMFIRYIFDKTISPRITSALSVDLVVDYQYTGTKRSFRSKHVFNTKNIFPDHPIKNTSKGF